MKPEVGEATIMDYLEQLRSEFDASVEIWEEEPGILQIILPIYHEDGDGIEMFVEAPKEGESTVRICDYGLTLMRLSYDCDFDSDEEIGIYRTILSQNGVKEDDGNLYVDTTPDKLFSAVMQLAQTIAKVSSLRFYKRLARPAIKSRESGQPTP